MKYNLKEIISGWKNFTFPNIEVEIIATDRMIACLDCEKITREKKCSLCGCFLPAKVRSLTSTCPLKKW